MRARAACPPSRWRDLPYLDLVRNPLATVRRIYDHLAIPFSRAAETGIAASLTRSPQHKRGVHSYTLAQFGLSAAEERRRYATYCEAHAVPAEP